MFKISLSLVVVLLLGACSFANKIPTNLDTSIISNDNSIVILSTTTNETCVASGSAFTMIRTTDNQIQPGAIFINNYAMKPDFESIIGNLYVFQVPPTTYTFQHEILNPYLSSKRPATDIFFTVKPNEVVYVGNIHNNGECNLDISIQDQAQRDLQLFMAKNPAIFEGDIVKRLMISN